MKPLLLKTCLTVILLIGYQAALVHSLAFGQEKNASDQNISESIVIDHLKTYLSKHLPE
jgi:hypothetical protein